METKETVLKKLIEECYTTPEKRDPTKPAILDGEFVKLNPDFDAGLLTRKIVEEEIKRRQNHSGTSFFLNFDPLCNLHQIEGALGNSVCQEIINLLRQRFIDVFVAQFPDNPPPMDDLEATLRVALCKTGQYGFNNGEIYFWLPRIPLKEDFVFDFLRKFKGSIDDNPIIVNIKETKYEVLFYGWGFRYY